MPHPVTHRIEFFAPRALFAATVGPNLEALREHRPAIDERVARLGLEAGEIADSFRALAAGYDATVEGEILMSQGALEVFWGMTTSGNVVAALAVVGFLVGPLRGLGRVHEYYQAARVSREKVRLDRVKLESQRGPRASEG